MSNTQTPRTDAAETNWWSEDGLRSAFIVRAEFARELERENATLTAERDEARRELCKRVESASCLSDGEPTTLASDYASWCGWDCFKEDGK
jgi:hypothetical protein